MSFPNSSEDTIFALSSPPGKGGVAVIRVSGPMAHMSLLNLIPGGQKLPKPRIASLRNLYAGTVPIDEALVLLFAAPKSFTGENIVEYHVHGGWSVVQSLLQQLGKQENHRLANPGEFTRRAFENNKLDLTEAEAIADLIDAETEAQRLQAMTQLGGTLERLYERWKVRLSHVLALMEADLDFSDQDLPDDILLQTRPDVEDIALEIAGHLNDDRRGERLRSGFKLAILGAPNAGKSSLLNMLSQREAAIVSSIAGTTRDVIETHLDIGGFPVILSDTAGLRETEAGDDHAEIEREGIKRSLSAAEGADIKILLFDGTQEPDAATLALKDDQTILVHNKCDRAEFIPMADSIAVSAITGQGMELLVQQIISRLSAFSGPRDRPVLTRARHREALQKAHDALKRFEAAALPELAAEDLRLAVRYLGTLTGRVDVEDLLDMIFRDFCIGK